MIKKIASSLTCSFGGYPIRTDWSIRMAANQVYKARANFNDTATGLCAFISEVCERVQPFMDAKIGNLLREVEETAATLSAEDKAKLMGAILASVQNLSANSKTAQEVIVPMGRVFSDSECTSVVHAFLDWRLNRSIPHSDTALGKLVVELTKIEVLEVNLQKIEKSAVRSLAALHLNRICSAHGGFGCRTYPINRDLQSSNSDSIRHVDVRGLEGKEKPLLRGAIDHLDRRIRLLESFETNRPSTKPLLGPWIRNCQSSNKYRTTTKARFIRRGHMSRPAKNLMPC